MRKQTDIEKALQEVLNVDRLLVFLEYPEGFRQMKLDKRQFKQMSDAISRKTGKTLRNGLEEVLIVYDDEREPIPHKYFEGMRDFYPEEDFKDLDL